MEPRIVAISGELQGKEFHLDRGRVSVGRDASNTIAPPDSAVSRRHCVIEWADDQAQVTDLESHNGTFVNGIPVSRRVLVHGDVLRVGLCELVYLTQDVPPSSLGKILYGKSSSSDVFKTVKLGANQAWLTNPTDVGRMARDLNALVKISRTINSIRDCNELQHRLLEFIFEVVPADAGAILLIDQPEDDPASIVAYDRNNGDSPAVSVSREIVQRALWEQSAVVSQENPGSDAPTAICVPLLGVQRTVGVLYLTSSGEDQKFGDDHIHFLNSAASIAAVTLENLLALESLKAENRRLRAELDPLEGMVGDGKAMRSLGAMINKVALGRQHRAHSRRKWHRQRGRVARHSCRQPARRQAVHRHQLRRHS